MKATERFNAQQAADGLTPVERTARIFGCTSEQARAQFLKNADLCDQTSAKAEARGKKIGGYTEQQWKEFADEARRNGGEHASC